MLGCAMGGIGGGSLVGWGLGTLVMLGFWGLLIWGAVHVIRNGFGGSPRADDVLARRFAAGEISEAEFRHHRATIREGETEVERRSHV